MIPFDISSMDEVQREAYMELALRELVERHFHEFVREAWPVVCPGERFIDGWHIRALCEHLEAVTEGKIKRLLCNVPPGTMKSILVCVMWPAWVWIKRPDRKFMFATYEAGLALRDSVRCRDLVMSQWYQERWPLALKDDQNTKGKWDNSRGGWRIATSVGGRGIGEHPDYKVFDDPLNPKQAVSELERVSANEWWDGTMEMRGAIKDAASVGIMQRLHAEDLSGHLLKKGGWVHICLPMRYEPPERAKDEQGNPTGDPVPRMPETPLGFQDPRTVAGELLWPQAYSEAKVTEIEVKLGLYHTAGQLQQRPTPKGGGSFQREWFKVLLARPAVRRWVRYWDKAGTKGGKGAQSCGVLMGAYDDTALAPGHPLRGKYVIANIIVFRKAAAEREAVIKQTAELDRKLYGHVETWTEQEPGSGGKESAENTIGGLDGFAAFAEKVTGSKEVRAEPLASAASVGKVGLLSGTWVPQFLDEVEAFPLGALRDMVDGSSGAYNKLAAPTGAFRPGDDIVSTAREMVEREPVLEQRLPADSFRI